MVFKKMTSGCFLSAQNKLINNEQRFLSCCRVAFRTDSIDRASLIYSSSLKETSILLDILSFLHYENTRKYWGTIFVLTLRKVAYVTHWKSTAIKTGFSESCFL